MVKPNVGKGPHTLESRIFFCSLEFAKTPMLASDLFMPLVAQLRDEWDGNFKAMDKRLAHLVRMTCRVNKHH